MSRPPLEVADIIRAAGEVFIERNRHWLCWKHVKVLRAIERCRTAALGPHLVQQLPGPPLPEVSDCRSGTVDRGASARTPPDALRPYRVHPAPSLGATGPAEQEGPL